MRSLLLTTALATVAVALPSIPQEEDAVLATRASCTVTEYSQLSAAVKGCTSITISGLAVPASSSLNLASLKSGTTVTFEGKTVSETPEPFPPNLARYTGANFTQTFGTTASSSFNPIVIGGTDITITGASGNVIDGNGASYWDGQGSNGGSAK